MCATQLLTILLLLTPLLSSIKEHKRQTRQQATILPSISHIRCDNNNFMTPDLLVSSISFALQKSFYLELVDDIGCIKHFFHIMKIRECGIHSLILKILNHDIFKIFHSIAKYQTLFHNVSNTYVFLLTLHKLHKNILSINLVRFTIALEKRQTDQVRHTFINVYVGI